LIVLASDLGRWSTVDVNKVAKLAHGSTGNALQGLFSAYNPPLVERLGEGWWQITEAGTFEAARLQAIRDAVAKKRAKDAERAREAAGLGGLGQGRTVEAVSAPANEEETLPSLSELATHLTEAASREVSEDELMREGMGWQPHKSAETVKSAPPLGPVPEPDSQDEVVFPEDEPIPELSLEALLLLLIGRLDDIGVLTVKARRYDQMGVNFEAFMDAVRRRQNEA